LQRLAPAPHIKLYNAGNFFDAAAVPPADRRAIAERVREHRTVVVENHPRLCGPEVPQFAAWLQGELEVAIGLETAHEPTLARLNKRMSVDDFCRAADRLLGDGQQLRTFVLLRPPGMSEGEGIDWAMRSVELSLQAGARCVSIVPVRGGNGIMEQLAAQGLFAPPSLAAAEAAMESALRLCRPGLQRVFFDLWDWQRMPHCSACGPHRRDRLEQMNQTQHAPPPIVCDRC
jgi:radical SAM enzyme (TIGR01210 family)